MLLSLFRSGFSINYLIQALLSIPCVLFALTIHEFSHGFIAKLMGDNTAKNLGRLTLNPIKHLDPIGALLMLFCGFGWAKPVPINSRNFRNTKLGIVLVSLAGPLSNLINAFISTLITSFITKFFIYSNSNVVYILITLFQINAILNICLAIFNLIPIPPLDGSKILFAFLPAKYYFKIMQYERYFSYILIALVAFGSFSHFISFASNGILSLFFRIDSIIFNINFNFIFGL